MTLGGVFGRISSGVRGLITDFPVTLAGLVINLFVSEKVTVAIGVGLTFLINGVVSVEGSDNWMICCPLIFSVGEDVSSSCFPW